MPASTVALDLSRRHFTVTRGIITAIGSWVRVDNEWQACLVLIRTGEEASPETFPCIVTQKKAWIWSEDIGDPRQAVHIARGFAAALRMNDEPKSLFKIATLIHDHLGDLMTIPISPPGEADLAALGELTITHRETGKTKEVVLRDV